jgi:hypothetical protein
MKSKKETFLNFQRQIIAVACLQIPSITAALPILT